MDRNEAIEHLKVVLKTCDVQDEEAVEMAIEALNCSEIPNNSDTISRQAAIDKIKKRLFETAFNSVGIKQNVDDTLADVAENRLENWFDELPSAEQDAPDINVGSMDAISRQAAKDIFTELYGISAIGSVFDKYEWADICETTANELPSVQPERPTGEWIQKPRYEDDEYPDAQPNLKCPFCGYEIGWCDMGNYCARCGADLKGGAE